MDRVKKHYKLMVFIAVVLLVVLVFCLAAPPSLDGGEISPLAGEISKKLSYDLNKAEKTYNNMVLAAENKAMELYVDSSNGNITVLDKKSGEYWSSNPEDSIIQKHNLTGAVERRARSQYLLTYYNENGLKQEYNTFEHSVSRENITVYPIKNGVAVNYKIGDGKISLEMLPMVLSQQDFEKIKSKASGEALSALEDNYSKGSLEKMSATRGERYKKLFTKLKESTEYYFIDTYTPDYALENLYNAIYKQGGYSFKKLEKNNNKLGYTEKSKELIQISFTAEYTIDDKGLNVRVPLSDLLVPDSIYVTNISVLPYFGAADTTDNGYIFVPDGSGGIINLNNGKTQTGELEIPIYGADGGIAVNELKASTPIGRIPVFAMKKNDKAFLSIIEKGDAQSNVYAAVSGVNTPLNQVYSSFNVLPFDKMVYKTSSENVSTNLYMDKYYDGDISLKYIFFDKENTSYVSLANAYRDYLLNEGVLTEKEITPALQISLTGEIEVEKSVIGIPYAATHTVTSFAQANKIAESLKKNGVDNINFNYSSWFGGGLATKTPYNVSPTNGMGGKKELNLLGESIGEENVALGSDIVKIWNGFPSFNSFSYANRLVTNKSAIGYQYNVATSQKLLEDDTYYMLRAQYLGGLATNYAESIEKLGSYSLWFTDAGNMLNSDFKKGEQICRSEAKEHIVNGLKKIPEKATVTLSDPNAYAFKFADKILALPNSSSNSYMINQSVPFLQIVLSGCVEYSAPSLNGNGNARENMLKCAEYGGDLYFDWIYATNESLASLNGSEARRLSSKNYDGWLDEACEYYGRFKNELNSIAKGKIIGHSQIAENVFKTDWQKGSVIVNYGSTPVTVNEITVPATDFIVIKE